MQKRKIVRRGFIFFLLFLISSYAIAQIFPEDPTRGGDLFVSKGCLACHSIRGKGGKLGPDLGNVDLGSSQLDLVAKIWNHTPAMIEGMEKEKISKPALTGEEFGEISSYLYFLRFVDEPGNAVRGGAVFSEKGCQFCHRVSGRSKDGAPGLDEFRQNLSPVFLSQAIWNHSLDMIARMVEIGMKWPTFRDAEMTDLLAYIKTNARGGEEPAFFRPGNPKQGRTVFASKGCLRCHFVYGEGAREGVDLGKAARSLYTSAGSIASSLWNKGPTVLVKMAKQESGIVTFTPKEMADLLAYLYFLRFVDEPGNPANGKRFFTEMACSQCHGLDGNRGRLMYIELSKYEDAPQSEIVASIWNHNMEIRKAIGEQGIPWPTFNKGEMSDLLEFLRSSKK
jgi:cytochrome c2